MAAPEILIITAVFVALFALRIGVPILVMWMLRLFCCRVLHAQL